MNGQPIRTGDQVGPGLLIVGESLIDLIADAETSVFTARPGGSPFNVAVGLARLGQPVTFVTEFGEDHCGRMLAARLRAEGMQVRQRRGPTSIAIAALDGGGDASYDFRFQWGLRSEDVQVRGTFAGIHTGSLACLVEPGRHAVLAAATRARRHGMVVSYDPNIRPALALSRSVARGLVEPFVAYATIVKVSVDDMRWLYPDEDLMGRLHRWAADGERLVVLTDGPRGCVAVTSHAEVAVPAPTVTVVNTVGAGDSFTAALLAQMHANNDLHRAHSLPVDRLCEVLEFANRAAALTCTHAGALSPTRR